MPFEVAAVLEDLVAEGAAINPLVLSGFVSLDHSPAVRRPHWAAAFCSRSRDRQLGAVCGSLRICTQHGTKARCL